MEQEKYLMTSLDKALKIIDILAEHPDSAIADITKLIDYNKSSLFKILYTLECNGFVTKNNDARYKLSLKFLEYGNSTLEDIDILNTINPHITALSKELNETVHFAVLTEDKHNVIVLNKVNSTHNIQMNSKVGNTLPVYCTGTGKALLSEYPNSEIEKLFNELSLNKYTNTTITDIDVFIDEIENIRKAGWSTDNEESEYGLTCFAVLLKGYNNQTLGAMSISGQTHRVAQNKDIYLAKLTEVKHKIEKEFMYTK